MAILENYVKKSQEGEGTMTPEKIMSTLFYFHSQAHFNHLQTRIWSRHKALDKLYKGLGDFKDEISELLLGYIAPARFSNFINIPIKKDLKDEDLVNMIINFSREVYEYGEEKDWIQLCNLAADLEGLVESTKYFLTMN